MITTIAFDADDTLWENEHFFKLTEAKFADLLVDYADKDHLLERLLAAERRNLKLYGYGIKGFMLSMVETAIEVTEKRIPASVIETILATGRAMLEHPVHLLPDVEQILPDLAKTYRLILITKGDLFDQERKIALSGLVDLFSAIEIVSEKDPATYRRIFDAHTEGAEKTVMVGNSLRSDIIPALEAGGWGVFIPHDLSWTIEHAEAPEDNARFRQLETLAALPELMSRLH
ncbi:MAG: HAD family hydrolase [Stappiaceae bacterium]